MKYFQIRAKLNNVLDSMRVFPIFPFAQKNFFFPSQTIFQLYSLVRSARSPLYTRQTHEKLFTSILIRHLFSFAQELKVIFRSFISEIVN